MFFFKLLQTPSECASCGRLVTSRMAGHCYQDPMCDRCFRQAAPELVEESLARQPECSIQLLDTRLHDRCANCGDGLLHRRIAGHHFADPMCSHCFAEYARELSALLILDEASLEAADGGRDAPGLLTVALSYSRLLYRLDEERPRKQRVVEARRGGTWRR